MGFSITATDIAWINGSKDNPEDLCLHGHAVARISNAVLEYDATISATALYLLKSITENHIIYQDNQMLPCCGFFIIANDDLSSVSICGCPNGIDWSVKHDGNNVILELEDGTTERVSLDDYTAEVFRFADIVESYYLASTPKILPKDWFDRDGYTAFWNEWHRRRGKRSGSVC